MMAESIKTSVFSTGPMTAYSILILAARACPASPSASPKNPLAFAEASAPALPSTVRNVVTVFKNTRTLNPPVKRALPDVGNVWFSPAA